MAKRHVPSSAFASAADRDAVARAFAAAAAGEGRALVLDPSLEGVAPQAAEAGLLVLHARAGGPETPFGTAVDLLAPAVDRLDGRRWKDAFRGAASLAEPLFADRARRGRIRHPPAGPATDFAVVHGLYWLTARLAERSPLALLVERAGSADEQSLRLCAYLAQRIDELPVALVLA